MAAQPIKLTDTIKSLLANALATKKPVVFSYVDDEGKPNSSFRGATMVYSETQLAIWVRNPVGGLSKAIERLPHVTLVYSDFGAEKRSFLIFRGRAHVDNADAVRQRVYDESPEPERQRDPQRKGYPIIIDLDSVRGNVLAEAVMMAKQ